MVEHVPVGNFPLMHHPCDIDKYTRVSAIVLSVKRTKVKIRSYKETCGKTIDKIYNRLFSLSKVNGTVIVSKHKDYNSQTKKRRGFPSLFYL